MRLAVIATALVLAPRAFAQETYLDDRSNAGQLVKSFYNAVNRKEYARAWDYFGDTKPARDFATFARGFQSTVRVDVLTGPISEEGAAGSIFYQVPMAIRATAADGGTTIFAGCYTARQVNGAAQEPPFRPIQLDRGKLSVGQEPLESAMPERCGDGPPPPVRDAVLDTVKASFAATYPGTCETLAADAQADAAKPDEYRLKFRTSDQTETDPEREARLFRISCGMGAYNSTEVWYFADDTGEVRQLQFAEPDLDITYENGNDEAKVEDIRVIGFTASDRLVNSEYDEAERTIRSWAKWRGVGDASSTGHWLFRDGAFTLVWYEVDASYDGEINPETVIDYSSSP